MEDIHVRLLSETKIETQIKFSDEAEWQPPVVLILTDRGVSRERDCSSSSGCLQKTVNCIDGSFVVVCYAFVSWYGGRLLRCCD